MLFGVVSTRSVLLVGILTYREFFPFLAYYLAFRVCLAAEFCFCIGGSSPPRGKAQGACHQTRLLALSGWSIARLVEGPVRIISTHRCALLLCGLFAFCRVLFSCVIDGFDAFGAESWDNFVNAIVFLFFWCHLACRYFAALLLVFCLQVSIELLVLVQTLGAHWRILSRDA